VTTRQRLLAAVPVVLEREGIAGTSARVLATEAGVNQALVFYHFDSVDGLLAEAAREISRGRAEVYTRRLAPVDTFTGLATEARRLHHEERAAGNLTVLTQLLAGSRSHPRLAPVLRDNFALLTRPVEDTLRRLLARSPLEGTLDPTQLARGIGGGFLGLQLLDGVVTDVDDGPLAALDALAAIVDVVMQAGTLETNLIRRKLKTLDAPR
jgi:AcrR family transcriptional regulator